MGEAARMVEDIGDDAVDIKLGLPRRRKLSMRRVSGLLRDMPLAGIAKFPRCAPP